MPEKNIDEIMGKQPGPELVSLFNYKQRFFIEKQLGTVFSKENQEGSLKVEPYYLIYEINFGSGLNLKNYLIANPNEPKTLGEMELYLRPLNTKGLTELEFFSDNPPEKQILEKICKEHKIPLKKFENGAEQQLADIELIKSIAQYQLYHSDPIIFVETTGIPESEMNKITPAYWETILESYLTGGGEKDKIILLTFKSDLIKPNPNKISPKYFQPYNSHELVFTNSKTTKSTTAKLTGRLIDSARVANLLGFSTANERVEGSLNGATETFSIDEIQEETNNELFGKLNTYLELGETETMKGKSAVKVKGFAGVRFLGNPKFNEESRDRWFGEETEETLYQKFADCLKIISTNNQAFGSRISFIVFRMDLTTFKIGKYETIKETEQNQAIVSAVMARASDNFTKLFFDNEILKWLNEPFSENYKADLTKIEKSTDLSSIKQFVSGHRELANRHARGKALRLACVDKALTLGKGNIDKKELLDCAEEYFKEIEEQNRESLSNLVSISSKEEIMKNYLKSEFELLPLYLKKAFDILRLHWNQAGDCEERIPFASLKPLFSELPADEYNFSRIQLRIFENISRVNNQITKFGIRASIVEGNMPFLTITSKKRLKELLGIQE